MAACHPRSRSRGGDPKGKGCKNNFRGVKGFGFRIIGVLGRKMLGLGVFRVVGLGV